MNTKSTFNFVEQLNLLPKEALEACYKCFKKERLEKGAFVIKEQQYCNKVHFIEKGAARAFSYKKGKEVTNWFAFENEALTSYYSFMTQKQSRENIQIEEDAILYSIERKDLERLYQEFHGIERLGRKIIEYYYNWQEERIYSLQCLSAKERYLQLMEKERHLLQRATLGQVASYLGITQETLSRIRKEILF
ncbi:MAG: Crp/Fnr family transcriptional regulator [Aureispira sp.]|nr:Crp/Fnr family transcriptional regulator [Aureispira sp.]